MIQPLAWGAVLALHVLMGTKHHTMQEPMATEEAGMPDETTNNPGTDASAIPGGPAPGSELKASLSDLAEYRRLKRSNAGGSQTFGLLKTAAWMPLAVMGVAVLGFVLGIGSSEKGAQSHSRS